ncbi:FAD:protein FMN transferase [bacterium]|nr:FAD:protein FMN transferase [bacterium]
MKQVPRIFLLLLPLLLLVAGCSNLPMEETRSLMGTQVIITVQDYDRDRLNSEQAETVIDRAFEEINRIENLCRWRQLKKLNSWAGFQPSAVGSELIALIDHAYLLAEDTGGAFRPDLGPLTRLWSVGTDSARIPVYWEIEEAQDIIRQTEFTVIDTSMARLDPSGAALDLGGVAKGYAVDRACEVLKQHGITAAMVWAGGDLKVFGDKPDGEPWRIAVRHPRNPEEFAAVLELHEDVAVATSGDYERYFEIDGGRYHHIIDPETGYPGINSISATVVTENCVDADAYATALFIIGPEQGLLLAESFGLAAMIMNEKGGEIDEVQTGSFRRLRAANEAAVAQ